MRLTGGKTGYRKKQKFEYLENKKSFLYEIKAIFMIFKRLSFAEKKIK